MMPPDLSPQAIPAVKHADTSFEVIPPIRNRWSPRAFLDKPVPGATLRILLEAARWSASCNNEQPWRFIVVTREKPEEFAKFLGVLVERNQQWAKQAPALLLSVGKKSFSHHGKPNRYGLYDTGAAVALMGIQAAAMGLQIHSMGGYDAAKARDVFAIPEDFEPGAAIAVGYPGPPQSLPEDFQKGETAPRTRKALSEIAFGTTWGQPAEL